MRSDRRCCRTPQPIPAVTHGGNPRWRCPITAGRGVARIRKKLKSAILAQPFLSSIPKKIKSGCGLIFHFFGETRAPAVFFFCFLRSNLFFNFMCLNFEPIPSSPFVLSVSSVSFQYDGNGRGLIKTYPQRPTSMFDRHSPRNTRQRHPHNINLISHLGIHPLP